VLPVGIPVSTWIEDILKERHRVDNELVDRIAKIISDFHSKADTRTASDTSMQIGVSFRDLILNPRTILQYKVYHIFL